jgi:hypothetical protein
MIYRRQALTAKEWLAAIVFVSIWAVLLLHAARNISEAAPRRSEQNVLVPVRNSLPSGTMSSPTKFAEP